MQGIIFRLLGLEPDFRIRPGHEPWEYLHAFGELNFLFLQEPGAGDPGAADVIEHIGAAQVTLLLSDHANLVLTAAPDALFHIIPDFQAPALIAIASHNTGTAGPAGELHILPVYLSRPLRFDFLGAALIIIEPACAAARAEGARKSLRNMWAGLFRMDREAEDCRSPDSNRSRHRRHPCGEPPPRSLSPDQGPQGVSQVNFSNASQR